MEKTFIWFDLGYTLVYQNREKPFLDTLRTFDLEADAEEVHRVFHLVDKHFMREFPHVFGGDKLTYMPWYFGMVQYRLGIRFDLCSFFELWQEAIGHPVDSWIAYPFAVEVLDELKSKGYRLGIISNWDSSARAIIEKHGFDRFFELIVISSEIGWEKPDVEIFNRAVDRAGAAPEQSIYVGDNYYDDAVGCRKAGLQPIIVNRYGSLGIEEIDDCPVIQDIREIEGFLQERES